jgi:hypothetical protein
MDISLQDGHGIFLLKKMVFPFGFSRIPEFGNLGIWEFGNLGISSMFLEYLQIIPFKKPFSLSQTQI